MKKKPIKKMLLYGKNSIRERLNINPESIRKILIKEGFKDQALISLINSKNIAFEFKSEKELQKTKRADRLQGIIAEIDPFSYISIDDILDLPDNEKPTIICLDSLNDPHNLGSILRICACFGNFAICLPEYQSCEINETVLHVCSGAENYVPVIKVTNLANTLKKTKQKGYWIAGTVVENGQELKKDILPSPLCLILGSEGKGISPGLQKLTDLNLTIPMQGAKLSFNVAMACAILCYEISK